MLRFHRICWQSNRPLSLSLNFRQNENSAKSQQKPRVQRPKSSTYAFDAKQNNIYSSRDTINNTTSSSNEEANERVKMQDDFKKFREEIRGSQLGNQNLSDAETKAILEKQAGDRKYSKFKRSSTIDLHSDRDYSVMYESQPGATGHAFARIKPVKKAFKRKPYKPTDERVGKTNDPKKAIEMNNEVSEENIAKRQQEENQKGLKAKDDFNVIDTSLSNDFQLYQMFWRQPEPRKLKTIEERIRFFYTRDRAARAFRFAHFDPTKFETWLINNEIRRVKRKAALYKFLRQGSSRNLMQDLVPKQYQDLLYLQRFQNQTGMWLSYMPAAMAIAMSTLPFMEQLPFYFAFLWFSFFSRAAGQVAYQISNYDIDKRINRSKARPLATGAVTHKQAYTSLAVNSGLALAPITFMHPVAFYCGLATLPLMAISRTVDKYTNTGQVVYAAAKCMPIFMAMAACLDGYMDPMVTVPAYLGAVLWTLYYDTLFSFQDVDKDPMLGYKSFMYMHISQPKKRVMKMTISDRSKQNAVTKFSSQKILFRTSMAYSGLTCFAMHNAGFSPIVFYSWLALTASKHWETKKILASADPIKAYKLYKDEQYNSFFFMLLAIIVAPIIAFAEELKSESLRKSTGGTMEYKAQNHHIMSVDKRVRLEDHRIWKENLKNSSGYQGALN